MWRAAVLLCFILQGATVAADNETWGYVEIRHKAHLFWWYYKSPHRVSSPVKPWPTILWLEGGPGGSGVGGGNFQGIGPLDVNLKPHNSTWLQKADLIFVDLPVGVGYSYVEDPSVLATTDVQVAADATELLKALTKEIPTLHSSPLFLVGESYGGKLAAKIGISVAKAIHAGALKLTLGGVVLGDSWISPDDFALSYAQLLRDVSRLSDEAVAPLNRMAAIVKEQIAAGQFTTAKMTWTNLVDLIDQQSDGVDMLNFLLDKGEGSSTSQVFPSTPNTIDGLMNGVVKEKLKVIPKNIIWQGVAIQVFEAMNATYMKPAIDEVDQLLAYGVNVSVYNGQFDVICSTIGVEAWVKKLNIHSMGFKAELQGHDKLCREVVTPRHSGGVTGVAMDQRSWKLGGVNAESVANQGGLRAVEEQMVCGFRYTGAQTISSWKPKEGGWRRLNIVKQIS
ncbi:serine carboxypeptidase-like 51 isoform X1 [Triticum dicoccoides]|uniref:serine carboxypeptidase-like 51 isoform X1 n=1 Tax=Triticum dicoccoides TaxID=85692 RepID=UPI001890B2D0|nr:serine carboxypeptidase-like 51 isoform X1 [Triticum dicoccoides]